MADLPKEKQLISLQLKLFMSAALALCASGLIDLVGDHWARPVYDLFFSLRGPIPVTEKIAIVAIDEVSFDELNMQWPWPRSVHAKLLDTLFAHGAKTVGLDILFAEPSTETEDRALADAVSRHKDVVLGRDISYFFEPALGYEQVKIVSPDSITDKMPQEPPTGFVSIAPDSDGYLRRLRLEFPDGPAFSLAAVQRFLGGKSPPVVELGWMNFTGPARHVPTVSYYQALNPEEYLPPDFFKDKLVFVGVSASSEANLYAPTADHFLVPFSRLNGAYMPGVEVHANAALSILRNSFIRRTSPAAIRLFALFGGFLAGMLFLTFRPLQSTVLYGLIATSLLGASLYIFTAYNRDIAPVSILLSLTLSYLACPFLYYWFTYKQKAFIRKAFSTYLSPRLVSELIANPDRLELGGEESEGTVVFLDLAGFTSFSEKLKPRELIELINRNLGECAEIILQHDGMIDKYIGDCIMAVWGVPVTIPDHAARACAAVNAIQENMKALSAKELAITGVNLSVRIGVNSGLLVAGNVGGEKHFNYTVLGNEVNLASRLEGINKFYGTDIIVSEATTRRVGEQFKFREVDIIRVVGQQKPTKIYQLWGKTTLTEKQAALDAAFQEGRKLYHERQWMAAKAKFEEASKVDPDDGPSKKYILRCDEYAESPPPPEWDGVYQMRSK